MLRANDVFTSDAAFDALPDWVALIDTGCVIRRVNRAMADQLGMRQDELVGKPCHEVMHGTGAPITGCPHMRLLAGMGESTHDIQDVAGRGVFEVSCTPLHDLKGGMAGSVHVMHDISRRVHVEAHAEETAHYLQQVLDAVPTPIYHKDAEGRYVAVNKAFAAAAGMDRDAIIGRTVQDVFPPGIAADYIESDRALPADGGSDSRSAWGWDAALGTRRVELHRSVYADLSGRPAGVVGVQFDVTEREKSEAALLRAQNDLVRAQAIGLMGSWEWDIAGGHLHWSDELFRIWGVDRESFVLTPETITERIHPGDRPMNEAMLSRIAAGADSAALDFRIIRPGGEVRSLRQTLEVERDETGAMIRAFGVMQDVTDTVQIREALRGREALLRGLFDTMPSGCAVHEVHGDGRSASDYVVKDMNHAGLRMVRRCKEEVAGKDLVALYGDDLDSATVETLWRVWRTGDPERFAVKRYDDGDLALWHDAFVLKLPSGEIVTISNDVTAEKRAEEAHRRSSAEVHAIFDLAGIPMLVMDTRGGMRRWNRALQKALGYPPEDLRRMTIRDVTLPEEHPEMLRRLSAALGDGAAYRVERRMVTADGQKRWFDVSVTPVLDGGGEVAALLLACTDVHERRLAEEALVQSQDQLREALGGTVASMGAIVAIRDPYTAGHERRVTELVGAIAEELGLDEAQLNGLRHAASVHDVGKVAVPAEILTMPRRLSEWEYSLIQTHVEVGHGVLADIAFEQPVATTVLQHHERLDGSGYPGRLHGDEIVLPARILAVADVVEAMASDRPYRPSLGVGAALDEIGWGAGRLYDEKVVAACQRVLRRGIVDLSTPPV
jgi:PAS domain S-box-containing protein